MIWKCLVGVDAMNATIKDVAKAAGVSVATVSRVLNNSASVSPAATEQVNDAIKLLGYSPNFLGRNLRKCETNIILGIIPSAEQTFYSEVIRGMQAEAAAQGYDILISTSNSNIATELRLLNMVYNRTVDAAVLLGTHIDGDTLNGIASKYNIALCCERVEDAHVLTVTVDDVKGAYDAVSALIDRGHTKIAMISVNCETPSAADRELGMRMAMADKGIPVKEEYFYRNTYDYVDGSAGLRYFMQLDEPPTAVFAISDLLAVGAVKQAISYGMKVGTDISIVGYDNTLLSDMFIPGIATVAQPCYQMGRTVVGVLIKNIAAPSHKNCEHIIMEHNLVFRDSIGEVKKKD